MPAENPLSPEAPAPQAQGKIERGIAALGTLTGFAALFSAAACCVLPLALAALGVGASGLAGMVPFHWPLTIAGGVAIAAGWLLYLRRRRACARVTTCATAPSRGNLLLLIVATAFVLVSACWSFIEAPLMRALAGA